MAEPIVVVESLRDWKAPAPSVRLVLADDYLADPAFAESELHVINLCRSTRYQSLGYYCSLLAEARGHRVLASVATLQDLSRKIIYGSEIPALAEYLDRLSEAERASLPAAFNVYLGRCDNPLLASLARRLFEQFAVPLLHVELRRREGRVVVDGLRTLSIRSLDAEQAAFLDQALQAHVAKGWRGARKRRAARFDVAMLVDASDPQPPSNVEALDKFVAAGKRLGLEVEIIGRRDFGRLAEFDGLFIRETTSLDHHTYRMARRAEHEGLVVIDDPRSILRCTNKVYLHTLLRTRGIATPEGVLLNRSDLPHLTEKAAGLSFPMVLKVPDGSFSRGIVKITSAEALLPEAERLFASSALLLLQEWLPTEFDWRIGVLDGKPLFASRYYMARGHWQIYDHSKGKTRSGGFSTHAPEDVPPAVIKAALKATRLIGNGLYGVDLKQVGDRVVVIEINDNPNIDAGVEDTLLGRALYSRILEVFLKRMEANRRVGA